MKLLLHACCAPCAIYPIKKARLDGFKDISIFFYNPNIHPGSEFLKRKHDMDNLVKSVGLEEVPAPYSQKDYFDKITDFENIKKRCYSCWQLRLEKTASLAKEKDFNAFTTTLLVSPYQDHKVLKEVCQSISEKKDIKFYYKDFRRGFKDAHIEARKRNMYCQNYCGCIFSLVEKEEARKRKKENSKDTLS